jgi:hypothetical protein
MTRSDNPAAERDLRLDELACRNIPRPIRVGEIVALNPRRPVVLRNPQTGVIGGVSGDLVTQQLVLEQWLRQPLSGAQNA